MKTKNKINYFDTIIKAMSVPLHYSSPIIVLFIVLMFPVSIIAKYIIMVYFAAWFYDISYMRWIKKCKNK